MGFEDARKGAEKMRDIGRSVLSASESEDEVVKQSEFEWVCQSKLSLERVLPLWRY